MKALVLHGPGSFRVEQDWPRPQARKGWAVVRVRFAGICGSDLPRFAKTGSYRHPMVLGHEFAGTVAEPAPGSTRHGSGEPVAVLPLIPCGDCPGCLAGQPFHCARYQFLGSRNDGGFAEYCLVPEENLFPLPEGLDLRIGAFIEPIAVTLHVARRSGFCPGQSALVFGAGSIGLLLGFWLRILGAVRVAFADVRAESRAMARRLGFEDVFDPSDTKAWDAARAAAPFDACFEAAGSSKALIAAIEATRDLGIITVVGRDTAETRVPLASFEQLMRKELTVRGCWGYALRGEEDFLFDQLRRGSFPLLPMITQEVALEQAPALVDAMTKGESYYCKAMIAL